MKRTIIFGAIVFGFVASTTYADRLADEINKVSAYLEKTGNLKIGTYERSCRDVPQTDTSVWPPAKYTIRMCSEYRLVKAEPLKSSAMKALIHKYMLARNHASHLDKEIKRLGRLRSSKDLMKRKNDYLSAAWHYEHWEAAPESNELSEIQKKAYVNLRKTFEDAYKNAVGLPIGTYYHL